MIAPGPDMLVRCARCGGEHRFPDPCPPKGEFSRVVQRKPVVPVFTEAEMRLSVLPPVVDVLGRILGRTPGVAGWEGGS